MNATAEPLAPPRSWRWHFPLRLAGGLNAREHFRARAARVAYQIGRLFPAVGEMTLGGLQELQRGEYARQARSLNDYWIKKRDPRRVDSFDWPIKRRAA